MSHYIIRDVIGIRLLAVLQSDWCCKNPAGSTDPIIIIIIIIFKTFWSGGHMPGTKMNRYAVTYNEMIFQFTIRNEFYINSAVFCST